MDCLILCDDIDSQELSYDLVETCLVFKLKPKLVLRQHFKALIENSRQLPPFLFFNETALRIENFIAVIDFHRKNPSFGIIRDTQGTIMSLNPSQIEIFNGEPVVKDLSKIFTASNAKTSYKLLPNKPPHILFLAHDRPLYLELSLNSLLFSLQPNADQVPITLILIAPTEEVVSAALKFQQKHPYLKILQIVENSHMATPLFVLQYLENKNQLPETFMVYEDDFILPNSVKSSYPNWPWWFAHRLAVHDMVAWLPSLDNCPTAIKWYINQHNLQITRNNIPGSRWLDSSLNNHLAISGNAVACNTQRYRLCAKRSNFGYPVDTELNSLASNISCPTVFGYHIGWNQEQDGFAKLDGRTWPKVAKKATIVDLLTKEATIIDLNPI
jgi:hypothetical protein